MPNTQARGTLSTLINKFMDFDLADFKCTMQEKDAALVLLLLKESDECLEKAGDGKTKFPKLHEQFAEFLTRRQVKISRVADKDEREVVVFGDSELARGNLVVDEPDARKHIERFRDHFQPAADSGFFREQKANMADFGLNQDLAAPFPRAMITFDESRLKSLLRDERPELMIDFSMSSPQIAGAVAKISLHDADVVREFFKRPHAREVLVEWGQPIYTPATGAFGLNITAADWERLSPAAAELLDRLWEKTKQTLTKMRPSYHDAGEMLEALNTSEKQNRFVATAIVAAMTQTQGVRDGGVGGK